MTSRWRLLLILLLLIPNVNAALSEYLLPQETSGSRLLLVEIESRQYTVQQIGNADSLLLVLDSSGLLVEEETAQKAFFSYYTNLYVQENDKIIGEHQKRIRNQLENMADSPAQQILNLFQALPQACVRIPNLEFLSVCIKPTENLIIMRTRTLLSDILDWDVAVDSYKSLVANTAYSSHNNDITKYDITIEFYEDLISMYKFLSTVDKIRNTDFSKIPQLNPDHMIDAIAKDMSQSTARMFARKQMLLTEENTLRTQTESSLHSMKDQITSLAKIGGNYEEFKSRMRTLERELASLNINDNRHRSDIEEFRAIKDKQDILISEIDQAFLEQKTIYDSKPSFRRFLIDIVGWFKALRI